MAVAPAPVTGDALAAQGRDMAAQRQAEAEPLGEVLSLDEAMARALKYNLDHRTKLLEEALALNLLDVTKFDLLPKLMAEAGYNWRSNDRISLSRDTTNPGSPLLPSRFISQERSHTTADLGLSWNLLDFGLGYYASKQQADRVLVALEKRRKAMHLLLQDVRIAYWRLTSAQLLENKLQTAMAKAEEALTDARRVEEGRWRDPADAMRFQRQILENLRILEAVRQELATAELELAKLINAPAGQTLRVSLPDDRGDVADLLGRNAEELEELALRQNPDLRMYHYETRIARLEARRGIACLFPNLNLSYSLNYDSDRYLANNHWNQVGARLGYNLLSIASYRQVKAYGKTGVALAEERALATHMAVLAQLHLSRIQLAQTAQQLLRARELRDVDQRLAELITNREKAATQSQLELVSAETAAILSELRYYQAVAQVQAAEARLTAVIGAEPDIPALDEISLADLAGLMRSGWSRP